MVTSLSRARALARLVIDAAPAYAAEEEALILLFETQSTVPTLSPALAVARRRMTDAHWSAGLATWNRIARDRLDLMRRTGTELAAVAALHEIFAADFSGRRFEEGLDAGGAVFPGHLILEGTAVLGTLRLDAIRATAEVRARGLRVTRDLTAEQALFIGPVRFDAAAIGGSFRLAWAEFAADADFDRITVGRDVWWRHARFSGALRMRAATIERDASLGCTYAGTVYFQGTRFQETVSLESARFDADLGLDTCRFDGQLLLEGISLRGSVSLAGTRFSGAVRPSLDVLGQAERRGSAARG
jgi:hypothetical protein